VQQALAEAGLPAEAVQLVQTTDREAVGQLIAMPQYVDVIIPRGGKGLIERISARRQGAGHQAPGWQLPRLCRRPVRLDMAVKVADNAKTQKYSPCNASEGLLVARGVAAFLPEIGAVFAAKGVEMRCDPEAKAHPAGRGGANVKDATEQDWSEEYLAPVISIKVVAGVDEAIAHINRYSSHHTDAILTRDHVQRAALPARGRLGQRDGECEHALRRRLRVRAGRGNRHQHRQVPCARPGGHRRPDLPQVDGAGQGEIRS
jgi:glutamate-5-semialdehyde dehydrogenase